MKAFQLKIVIKNSKPPIWRRVIVPAGITFSQLSIILNEVMGWCGYHMFEFEFYHREIRLVEEADEFDIGYGPFDYIEASTTYIREYLEENDWFTYTYDLGDDWQHRVTIEKILDDYENEYPQVIKFKGDCPLEDCGGIRGYYELLEIISDPIHPQYEESLEWMKSQGYPWEYDMELVNSELKQNCFYKWGKGEKRCQSDIYEDHFSGKMGLNATKRDKNKNVKVKKSGKHQLNETMQMFVEALNRKEQWERTLKQSTLADIFNDFTKEDIIDIIKEKEIKGLTARNKDNMIRDLVEHMLKPKVIWAYFACMQEDEIQEFEKAANSGELYESENIENLLKLYEAGYIGMIDDGRVMIPSDVVKVYRSFDKDVFGEYQKKMSYLLCCLETLGILYGIAPMSILLKLIERNPSIHMQEAEIRENIPCIPPEYGQYRVIGDMVYYTGLYPDDGDLQAMQGDKDFYIPTLTEIMDYGTVGYDPNNRNGRRLKQFLVKHMDAEPDLAEHVIRLVQIQITGGCDMQDVFYVFEEMGLEPPDKRHLDDLIQHISNLWNHTRMILNRGFTPEELSSTVSNHALTLSKRDNVIDFETVRKQKIYPNDPCPCGSGRKYKNCCKNKGN